MAWVAIAASEQTSISPEAYVSMLGKGFDVDWSKTKAGQQSYSSKCVTDFKAAGLGHVRIRVKGLADRRLFATLDPQIDDCLKQGLIPIVAYQADDFKKQASKEAMAKVVEWWRVVAERYKTKAPRLAFDLVIEVTDAMNREPDLLNELYEKCVSAIRVSNPHRIIFVSPRVRSSPEYLHELLIPSKGAGFMLAEWHFYASGPSKTNPLKLWTTGSAKERELILAKIRLAKEWERKSGIKTWVGAWMTSDFNDGNHYSVSEQVAFAKFVAGQLDANGIPFAVNSDTKFYDRQRSRWIPQMQPVLKALLKPS